MSALLSLLDVNNVFFTILNYPISYVEFIGTIFNLACVWLVARKNIWNWPIGIVGVVFFGILFYQINLYADLLEQFYFFVTGFWGWYLWSRAKKPKDDDEEIVVKRQNLEQNLTWASAILLISIVGSYAMSNLHIWLPAIFPEPASLPFLDTITTVMSFAATILMMQRKLENWVLWITVDVIAVGLYWYKGVPFIALLYLIFLFIASSGFVTWLRTYQRELAKKDTV